jgi:large subunit ribosomal protein L18
MSTGPRYRIKTRRRRQGITDYRKRLALIKSGKPRIVVRKSLKHMRVQFIDYQETGDKVLISALGSDLVKEYKWKHPTSSTPAAYLIGLIAGKKAKEAGISEGVFDIGRQVPVTGSKVFAAIKGVHDAGIDCYVSEEKLPSEDRLLGKHLKDKKIAADTQNILDKLTGGK